MLGTTGAVANARWLSEQRQREGRLVESLLTRLAISEAKATKAA